MHKSGPKQAASLVASPLVASTLESAPQPQLSDSLAFDAWSQACPALSQCPGAETWVTPGLCRMDSVDQLRSWTSDMLAQMSTTGLAIMFDERKNMVKGQSFHIHDSGNAVKPEEGNTECWLWHATMGKRKLFAGILKHSKYPLTPRFLRISLRYHGHVEAQRTIRAHAHQVRFVLEGSGASTSPCEELRHSQDQGGVADRTAGDTSGHLDTGDPHDFECERTQAPLPNSPRVQCSSSVSMHTPFPAESGRTADDVCSAQSHHESSDSLRRNAIDAADALGGAVPTGRGSAPSADDSGSDSVDCHDQANCSPRALSNDGTSQCARSDGEVEQEEQPGGGQLGCSIRCGRRKRRSHAPDPRSRSCSPRGIDTGSDSQGCPLPAAQEPGGPDAEGKDSTSPQSLMDAEVSLYNQLFQCHRKTLSKAERRHLLDDLEVYDAMIQDVACLNASVAPRPSCRKKPVLLEVFAGSMHLTQVACQRGWTCLQPVDVDMGNNGVDLTSSKGQAEIDAVIEQQQPDLVTWAPPCGPYSPLQNIMPRNALRRHRKWIRLLRKRRVTGQLWKYCLKHFKNEKGRKRHVQDGHTFHVVENPWLSAAWKQFDFPGYHARVDQCRFGLKIRKHDRRRVKKPTRLQCSDSRLPPLLETHCSCPQVSGQPRHEHIISGDKINGKWVSRSQRCGAWPSHMCHHILAMVEHVLGWHGHVCETHVTQTGQSDFLLPYECFAEEQTHRKETESQPSPELNQSEPQSESQKTNDLDQLVYRLHCKFGHPANSMLARTLRLGGARAEVVEAAKRIRCSTCDRVRAPKDPPRVGVPKTDQFNEVIGVDLFYVQDCKQQSHMVLSMVDHATTFHVLRLVPKRSPKEVAVLFSEAWVGTFGAPKQIIYDQGSEFKTEFEELLMFGGTLSTVIPVETHWHGGVV